jgi:hypothetical protein
MTKNEDRIKDLRSTGRRRARKALYESYTPFQCVDCGKTSKEPPKDAPKFFDEIWPTENRTLTYSLQADHETKDLLDNDVSILNWRCEPCHKIHDKQTAVGESTIKREYF